MKILKILVRYYSIESTKNLLFIILSLTPLLSGCGKKGDPKSVGCDLVQTNEYQYPQLDNDL